MYTENKITMEIPLNHSLVYKMHLHPVVYVWIFGASLSKPHTSVTSLCARVCMFACLLACLLAWTNYLPKILNKRV